VVRSQTIALKTIRPFELPITTEQTTNIIFPYAIQSVDRGSEDLFVQKARDVDNILQLKAARNDMPPTNVTVVTSDGQFYSFVLHYEPHPQVLNVAVYRQPFTSAVAQVQQFPVPADQLQATATSIRFLRARLHTRTKDQWLGLRLCNVFVDSTTLWCTLRLRNSSAVGFHPDILRCYVKEKRMPRRTAMQEKVLTPIYSDPLPNIGCPVPLVFSVAFRPFTIKRSQRFYIQVGERSGARVLTLSIKYKTLLKARPLP
jgi:conjugative transposon TraN protein